MKIGIVSDNYKLEKFKKELTDNGFTDFEILPFSNDTSQIHVITSKEDVDKIKKICHHVELHFKHSN